MIRITHETFPMFSKPVTGFLLTASILFSVACTQKVKEKEQVRSPEAQASFLPYAAMAARIDNVEVVGIQLTFSRGNIARLAAEKNQSALESYLNSGQGLRHFREFALGFNPGLVTPEGEPWVAYYGYGAGVVRLSLGDNTELGGRVRGGGARWFFFRDATVRGGAEILVDEGKLQVNR